MPIRRTRTTLKPVASLLPPLVLIIQFLIESHVTERQDEEARGTRDANVHYVHTGGA